MEEGLGAGRDPVDPSSFPAQSSQIYPDRFIIRGPDIQQSYGFSVTVPLHLGLIWVKRSYPAKPVRLLSAGC